MDCNLYLPTTSATYLQYCNGDSFTCRFPDYASTQREHPRRSGGATGLRAGRGAPKPVDTHHRNSRMANSGFGSVMPGASNSVRVLTTPLLSSCASQGSPGVVEREPGLTSLRDTEPLLLGFPDS